MTSVLVVGDQGLAVRRFRCAADGRRAMAPIESDGIGASFMRRVCAWCRRDLGVVACGPQEAGSVTHGMCPECLARTLAELPGVPHNLGAGGGLEGSGANSRFGLPRADAALPASAISPVAPGADGVAAGAGSGQSLPRVNGPAGSVVGPWAQHQKSDEHAGARPAASSAKFWTVSGADFGRAIRWARERWRNPLDALVRAKINQIKEARKS